MVDYAADRIADESEIRPGKRFPYQYFAAYLNAGAFGERHLGTPLILLGVVASRIGNFYAGVVLKFLGSIMRKSHGEIGSC
jgi:hypothetical protein